MNDSAGKPLIGGPFTLVTDNGTPVSDLDYRGKYLLLYFGYTFCPDVCPEELEKMAKVVDAIKPYGELVPLFVSCDPKRDSLQVIKNYLKGKIEVIYWYRFPSRVCWVDWNSWTNQASG